MGTTDSFVTMYDSLGNKVRTKQLGVSGNTTAASGVAVDSSGNVYVAGYTTGGLDSNTLTGGGFFVTKYDSAGNKQ
jgi:Beta-propeller repeat